MMAKSSKSMINAGPDAGLLIECMDWLDTIDIDDEIGYFTKESVLDQTSDYCEFFWFWRFRDSCQRLAKQRKAIRSKLSAYAAWNSYVLTRHVISVCRRRLKRRKMSQRIIRDVVNSMQRWKIHKSIRFWHNIASLKKIKKRRFFRQWVIALFYLKMLRFWKRNRLRFYLQMWRRRSKWPIVVVKRKMWLFLLALNRLLQHCSRAMEQRTSGQLAEFYHLHVAFFSFRAQLKRCSQVYLRGFRTILQNHGNLVRILPYVSLSERVGRVHFVIGRLRKAFVYWYDDWILRHRRHQVLKSLSKPIGQVLVLSRAFRGPWHLIRWTAANKKRAKLHWANSKCCCCLKFWSALTRYRQMLFTMAVVRFNRHFRAVFISQLAIRCQSSIQQRQRISLGDEKFRVVSLQHYFVRLQKRMLERSREHVRNCSINMSLAIKQMGSVFQKLMLKCIRVQQQRSILRYFSLVRGWSRFREGIKIIVLSISRLRRASLRHSVQRQSNVIHNWYNCVQRKRSLRQRLRVFRSLVPFPKCSRLGIVFAAWRDEFLPGSKRMKRFRRQVHLDHRKSQLRCYWNVWIVAQRVRFELRSNGRRIFLRYRLYFENRCMLAWSIQEKLNRSCVGIDRIWWVQSLQLKNFSELEYIFRLTRRLFLKLKGLAARSKHYRRKLVGHMSLNLFVSARLASLKARQASRMLLSIFRAWSSVAITKLRNMDLSMIKFTGRIYFTRWKQQYELSVINRFQQASIISFRHIVEGQKSIDFEQSSIPLCGDDIIHRNSAISKSSISSSSVQDICSVDTGIRLIQLPPSTAYGLARSQRKALQSKSVSSTLLKEDSNGSTIRPTTSDMSKVDAAARRIGRIDNSNSVESIAPRNRPLWGSLVTDSPIELNRRSYSGKFDSSQKRHLNSSK